FLAKWLIGQLRIDARAPKEYHFLYVILEGGPEDVVLDQQVLVQEFPALGVVGLDAANLGGGEQHDLGPLLAEEIGDRALIAQIQLGTSPRQQPAVAAGGELSDERRADEPVVAGDGY